MQRYLAKIIAEDLLRTLADEPEADSDRVLATLLESHGYSNEDAAACRVVYRELAKLEAHNAK